MLRATGPHATGLVAAGGPLCRAKGATRTAARRRRALLPPPAALRSQRRRLFADGDGDDDKKGGSEGEGGAAASFDERYGDWIEAEAERAARGRAGDGSGGESPPGTPRGGDFDPSLTREVRLRVLGPRRWRAANPGCWATAAGPHSCLRLRPPAPAADCPRPRRGRRPQPSPCASLRRTAAPAGALRGARHAAALGPHERQRH
jgi:hypothetical protein